ncbi:hypothetical protein C7974DRAFT_433317 [Boeremia exigua]|uniref:uncharacterized protein n=1 Tax=Boeremia exigua TaxID=749465 RepID=UPI001E8D1EC4|nr:uncharacterized protein C7974DRAFT_433317 [Boeremia exigua]KAH6633202.1 hypothetical protein C7974DRAFT_433317 [Boeremia exigua]
MDIQSLLNPSVSDNTQSRNTVSTSPKPLAPRYLAHSTSTKRQKLAKDAPVFSEGTKIVGHVNYPPHEAASDRFLEARHCEYSIFPLGQIFKKGVRHIPYASDKKDFLEKTGRGAFEVFQYTYKRPGEDKEYVVVWDYNIGLVRMTPFFKSCKYSKTVPAKALNQNPGMKDISYSITGGALVCQGYWVPWQAARKIAATFCWDIRWALTPVFGNDFPQMCRHPQDHAFAKFGIDSGTIKFCKVETDRFKEEGDSYQLLRPKAQAPVTTSVMPALTSPEWKQCIPATPSESGYGTDLEHDKIGFSIQVSPRTQYRAVGFTPVNEACSPTMISTAYPSTLCSPVTAPAPTPLPVPTPILDTPYPESFRTKRTHSKIMCNSCDSAVVGTDSLLYERQDALQSADRLVDHSPRTHEAAEILLSMGVVARNKAVLSEAKRTRRGSRY